MSRRDFFRLAAAVPVVAVLPAAAASVLSHDELIAHHKQELWRLLCETVPAGTVLDSATLSLYGGRSCDFMHLSAFKSGHSGRNAPFYCRTTGLASRTGNWEYNPGNGGGA